MSKEMKSVTRYECQHCKKLFHTPDKHNCRRDPDKTNCYSCEHWKGQFSFDSSWDHNGCDITCEPKEACAKHETSYVDDAFELMRERGWYLNCPVYKRKEATHA